MTFKNIRISKRGGGTRLQRVKVLASGKHKFVKNLIKSKSRTTKSKTKTTKRRTKKLGKKKKRRGGKSLQATIFKWMRVGAIAAPGIAIAIQKKSGQAKIEEAVEAYFGYNIPQQKMVWGSLLRGWGPFLAATLVTYGLPKLAGILRRI